MIGRILDAIRRWWYRGSGLHERPYGGDDFDSVPDVTEATIPRRRTLYSAPWESAPLPVICLLPAKAPEPPWIHPIVRAQLGADSVAELVERLFPNIPYLNAA